MRNKNYISTQDISASFSSTTLLESKGLGNNHFHDRYEILYISAGTGVYIIEGTEYDVRPGTLMFVRPNEYHFLRLEMSPESEYERYCIHFTHTALGQDVARVLDRMKGEQQGQGNYYAPLSLPIAIDAIFDRFELVDALPEEDRRTYVRAIITELILTVSAAYAEKRPDEEGELGSRVIRYLNNNIHKDLSLEKLARRFFVSKYYLCRAFKKYNGISIHSYINHKRVLCAKQLIESGETASGAAYKVGFGDYSAFYRAYVKLVGKSPTAEQAREEQQ